MLCRTIAPSVAAALLAQTAAAQIVHDPLYTLSTETTGLTNPQGVALDTAGNAYVADSGAGRILRGPFGGTYAPIITGIPVSPFNGLNIGPLGLMVAPNQTLVFGEGGGLTGTEQVHHHTLTGAHISSLPPVAFGGNWAGFAVDPANGRLLATSANGDRIFAFPASGNSWGAPTTFITTAPGLIAPTGIAISGNTLYAAFFGSFAVGVGEIATYDLATGTLLNAAFSTGIAGPTGIAVLPGGDLVLSEFGGTAGTIYRVNASTGGRTLLVSGIGPAGGVAVGLDGSIFFTEMGTLNTSTGRLLRLTPIPSPAAALVLILAATAAPRRRR